MMVRFKQRLGADHNEQNRLNDEKKLHQPIKMKEILDAIVYPPLEETEESVQESDFLSLSGESGIFIFDIIQVTWIDVVAPGRCE